MFHQRGHHGERFSVFRPNGLLIHVYLSESPVNESFHEMEGKHTVSDHGAPRGRKGVRPGSPRGPFTTLLSLPQCHAAFSTIPSTLAWVDQSPVSQRVVVSLYRVLSTPVTASQVTKGTDQRNPEVRTRGWIYWRLMTPNLST